MAKTSAADAAAVKELKRDLSAGTLGRLYIFHGEEAYLRDFYLGQMKKKLLSGGMEAFNLHTFQAKECDPKALSQVIDCLPMMSERTMVVVYDYDLFKTGVVLFERDVDRGLVVDGNKLALVADETEVQRFLAGNRDRVASFDVGGGTARRIRDRNCYTYDRIAALVFNDTRNGISPPLCRSGGREGRQNKRNHKESDSPAVICERTVPSYSRTLFHYQNSLSLEFGSC